MPCWFNCVQMLSVRWPMFVSALLELSVTDRVSVESCTVQTMVFVCWITALFRTTFFEHIRLNKYTVLVHTY